VCENNCIFLFVSDFWTDDRDISVDNDRIKIDFIRKSHIYLDSRSFYNNNNTLNK